MNYTIRIFKYRFYVKEILLIFFMYLLMENIFSWLFIQNQLYIEYYEKILSLFIYGFMLYKLPALRTSERICIGIFSLLLLRMVIESLYKYNTFFEQFTMFTILYPVVFALFIKYICRLYNLDLLEFVASFYLITYIVFMAVFGHRFSFSLATIVMNDYGPFSGDTRIIHANSILMMIIPFLYYLHQFITTKKNKFLLLFVLCSVIILIHQHRSVWSSAIVALSVYIFALSRNQKNAVPKFFKFGASAILVLFLVYFFVSNINPHFVSFLSDRFSEIFNPAKENSTGDFRIQQSQVYGTMFLKRPLFGWTFEGFEMPNPMVDWWPAMTGQHFHEGYIEMLFYEGITGFLLKYLFLFYLVIKAFSKKLSHQSVILIAFGISGLVFSFSYVPPIIFWAHVGLCLFYIERDTLNYNSRYSTSNRLPQKTFIL